jgi:hypothetical protein
VKGKCIEENCRILTNKEIYLIVKKQIITEITWLNKLQRFGHVERMEENIIPKGVLYMNTETKRLRGRPKTDDKKNYTTEGNGRSS